MHSIDVEKIEDDPSWEKINDEKDDSTSVIDKIDKLFLSTTKNFGLKISTRKQLIDYLNDLSSLMLIQILSNLDLNAVGTDGIKISDVKLEKDNDTCGKENDESLKDTENEKKLENEVNELKNEVKMLTKELNMMKINSSIKSEKIILRLDDYYELRNLKNPYWTPLFYYKGVPFKACFQAGSKISLSQLTESISVYLQIESDEFDYMYKTEFSLVVLGRSLRSSLYRKKMKCLFTENKRTSEKLNFAQRYLIVSNKTINFRLDFEKFSIIKMV